MRCAANTRPPEASERLFRQSLEQAFSEVRLAAVLLPGASLAEIGFLWGII
jgi:hypothetical protein